MIVQYWKWISGILLRGDFGLSLRMAAAGQRADLGAHGADPRAHLRDAARHLGASRCRSACSRPCKKYSIGDYSSTFLSFLGLAIPSFLLALVLMYVAAVEFGQEVGGLFSEQYSDGAVEHRPRSLDLLQHLWIPVIILAVSGTASLIRVMRANMLDELQQALCHHGARQGPLRVPRCW